MPGSEFEYDAFLSHASEDSEWSEKLAERLRDEGVRVWFDKWELQPFDNLLARVNDAIEKSRKFIAVWTVNYFRAPKVCKLGESYIKKHSDMIAEQRLLIPLLHEDCTVPATLRNILSIDCRNDGDFDLRFRELVQALDIPRRDATRSEELFEAREYDRGPGERPRLVTRKGKRFEDDVSTLYRLLGFEVKQDVQLSGFQIDLMIERKQGGLLTQAIVECKDKRITADERNQILAQQNLVQKKLPAFRWLAVSSQGFTADARTALTDAGVACATYSEILRELVPLDHYVEALINDYETSWIAERWNGEDWFIRPDLKTDITFETKTALEHIGRWLGDSRGNLMVVLGDLGAGKSTLASFLAYNLAKAFRSDPIRQPAPVLTPLKDVRKENSLESIIISHFSTRGFQEINFVRFIHLVRLGKVVLFFDAFDEMADRVRSDVTYSNFRELRRAAEHNGKVILTCRTHYFKDRNEQVTVIGEGPKLSEIETGLYRELRKQSSAEVVYLQEFDEEKILGYLAKARPGTVDEDWQKIQEIHNLKDLATRPLLLDMIVNSLSRLDKGQPVNAANLYTVYTNIWVDREEEKGRFLDKRIKLALMLELASKMWNEGKPAIHYHDLLPFLKQTAPEKMARAGEEELLDIAREIQGASFLKRMDDEGNFSFMHRSFMEFFLARKFFQHLIESEAAARIRGAVEASGSAMSEAELQLIREAGILDVLDTNRLDRKVIYFLTLLDSEDKMREPLQRVLTGGYLPRVSENALQILYWSKRTQLGMDDKIPDPDRLREEMSGRIPPAAQLGDAQLQEIVLEAVELSNCDFDRADLTGAKLNHARISGCSFHSARLEGAQFDSSTVFGVNFREANLTGASFGEADIDDTDFRGVVGQRITAAVASASVRNESNLLERSADSAHLTAIVQCGHTAGVQAVAYSPHGELIASGAGDGVILIHRTSDGRLLRAMVGHTGVVSSVAFSPDGESLASGSYDHSVRLWDLKTGRPIRRLEGHINAVMSVAFSPDGESLASGSDDHSVRLWELKTGRAIRGLEGHTDRVMSVAFSPDGESLASGGYDNNVRMWEVKTGRTTRVLEGHMFWVSSVAFSPDGESLASGSSDKSVRVWEAKTGREIRALEGHTDWVMSVAFSPGGESLASGSDDNSVRLWEVKTGRLIRALEGNLDPVHAVSFAPNGKYLIAAGAAGRLRFWDVETGETFLYRYAFGPGEWLDLLPDGRFNASPEGMRYLCYTERDSLNSFTAESLVKDFYDPQGVQDVLARYTSAPDIR